MAKEIPKVRKVCKECGSDNVKKDAWAEWDENRQRWSLGETFQQEFCCDCDGETTIIDEPIESD